MKLVVIGNSGSGKTWISKRIARACNLTHIQLDHVFWMPGGYGVQRGDAEVEARIKMIQASDHWVAEGVFGHLAGPLAPSADVLIFLDLPWEECRKNLKNRGSESAKQRDPAEAKKNFNDLLLWASEYDHRKSKASKQFHSHLFDQFPKEKHRITHQGQIAPLLARLSHLAQLSCFSPFFQQI